VTPRNRLQVLFDLSRVLSSSLELEDVLRAFAARAAELTGATAADVSLWDPQADSLSMLLERKDGTDVVTVHGGAVYALDEYPATSAVLVTRRPLQIQATRPDHDVAERRLLVQRGLGSLLMLPLAHGGETIGLMEVVDVEERVFAADDVEFCQALCDVLAPALHNATLYARMRDMALRDQLTHLYNRRHFESELAAAIARALRSGEPLALLVVDLDGLKRINDHGGHQAGDRALRAAAEALLGSIRTGDGAFRLGGDEFAVILPGATQDEALGVAERAQLALNAAAPGEYSFSGGVATGIDEVHDPYALYRAADIAAYRAKSGGGAQTLLAS
jgi:diguanylate cyclase (GGDEF)-like protein